MATCFLHIGAGKTGTSAIQALLPSIRPELLKLGLLYPEDIGGSEVKAKQGLVSGGNAVTLARLANKRGKKPAQWNEDQSWDWLKSTLLYAKTNDYNVLFSAESLQFGKSEQLIEIRNVINKHRFEIKVIYFTRTAIDYSISSYLQNLKMGFPSGEAHRSLSEYIGSVKVPYKRTITEYVDAFGKDSLSVYNYSACTRPLIPFFLDLVVYDNHNLEYKSPSLVNRSLVRAEQLAFESIIRTCNDGMTICREVGKHLSNQEAPREWYNERYQVAKTSFDAYSKTNLPLLTWVNDNFLDLGSQLCISSPNSKMDLVDFPGTSRYMVDAYCRIIEILGDKLHHADRVS